MVWCIIRASWSEPVRAYLLSSEYWVHTIFIFLSPLFLARDRPGTVNFSRPITLTKTTMFSSLGRCLFALLVGMTYLRTGECGYAPDKSPELPDGVRCFHPAITRVAVQLVFNVMYLIFVCYHLVLSKRDGHSYCYNRR